LPVQITAGTATIGVVDQGAPASPGSGWRFTEYSSVSGLPNFYNEILGVVGIPTMVAADPITLGEVWRILNGAGRVAGDQLQDSAEGSSRWPVKIGGRANANEPTAVSADDVRVDGWWDRTGRLNVANWPKRSSVTTFQSAVTLNNTTTTDSSSSLDVSTYRSGFLYFNLTKAGGTSHAVDIFPEFSDDGGTDWFPIAVDHFVKMRFTAGQIGSGLKRSFPIGNDYIVGRLFRITVNGITTTASNTITVTTTGEFAT
jgi:hypothetical protein